jgi:SAM-dependent methyltransferase
MSDILAGHGADPDELAALYDLEHDDVTDDLAFWRQLSARHPGPTIDLGCGSGRVFGALLSGGARPLIGLDGSPSLLRRAESRIAGTPELAAAAAAGLLRIVAGDVGAPRASVPAEPGGYALVVIAGVLPHLAGPEDAVRMLEGTRGLLARDGRIVLDDLGPALLPQRDLPLSVDWERTTPSQQVVRRSELTRAERPDGLHVAYATITDTVRADGTIARLPASFRLWYPTVATLLDLVDAAGLKVELTWGSYDLEPYDPVASERRIVVAMRDDAED